MTRENTARETILIIEDDTDIQELVQYNLERQGYKVITANDGESGFKAAVQRPPDLVILDIMLPGIDGLTVCRRLRENNDTRHLPILMLTARGEESDIVIGLELGADDYVTKPFSPKELVARVRAVLRRSKDDIVEPAATKRIVAGPVEIDDERHEAIYKGQPLK